MKTCVSTSRLCVLLVTIIALSAHTTTAIAVAAAGTDGDGDQFIEHHSYIDRLKKSFENVLLGIALVLLTPIFLWIVEQQAVKFEMIIARCQKAVREIHDPNTVNAAYENRPVLVKDNTKIDAFQAAIMDEDTGYKPGAGSVVRLRRTVEMYQWVEHRERDGDDTVYTYSQEWRENDYNSNDFKNGARHHNPRRQPNLFSTTINSHHVFLGAYRLSDGQINMLHNWKPCVLRMVPDKTVAVYQHLHPQIDDRSSSSTLYYTPSAPPATATATVENNEGSDDLYGVEKDRRSMHQHTHHHRSHDHNHRDDDEESTYSEVLKHSNSSDEWSAPREGGGGGAARDNEEEEEEEEEGGGGGGGQYLTFNGSPDLPRIGTVRISYSYVPVGGPVTTVAVQSGTTFRPFTEADARRGELQCCTLCGGDGGEDYSENDWESSSLSTSPPCCLCCWCCCASVASCLGGLAGAVVGTDVMLVEERFTNIRTMFGDAASALHCRLILTRLVSYFLLSVGIYLIVQPVAVLLSFIPILGGLLANTLWAASLILGFTLGLLITSIAWFVVRPYLLGVGFLSTGLIMWFLGDGSAHTVLLGQALCCVSMVPFAMMVLRWVEDCRFASRQKELDRQQYASSSRMATSTAAAVTVNAMPVNGWDGSSNVVQYELVRRDDKV